MKKNIVLIGMPGSGKSTIGFLLSKILNMQFIDMDEYIEKFENKTIEEMFYISEDYFRDVESKVAHFLSKCNSHIISTGGGFIKRKENIELFKDNSIIVFINRPLENILKDIDESQRPLLKDNKEKLFTLYKERIDLYKEYSHIEILNNGTALDAVNLIVEGVEKIENKCN